MMALSRHIGTTRITASGSDQLSYWAASTRKTMTTAKAKIIIAVLPGHAAPGTTCRSIRRPSFCGSSWSASCSHQVDGLARS